MSLCLTKPCRTFHHFVCNYCQKEDADLLKQCTGCKLVYYCSVAHQKTDWKHHRNLCRSVNEITKELKVPNILGYEEKKEEEWKELRLNLVSLLEKRLMRRLQLYEEQMFLFPKVCSVCFSAKVNKNYKCDGCKISEYCSEEHKNKHLSCHKKYCFEIRRCYTLDVFTEKYIQESKEFSEFPFLSKTSFPRDSRSYFDTYSSTKDCSLVSDPLSGVLTLLHTIFSYSSLSDSTSLTIHAIGASKYELTFISALEVFFHCMPNLRELHLSLVGPEIEGFTAIPYCDTCIRYTANVKNHRCLYHDFIRSGDFVIPDIVVAFNCGFDGPPDDTWGPTLRQILDLKNIYFVFTSYTGQEAIADFKRVKNVIGKNSDKIYFHEKHKANPFRSLRPQRNWLEEGEGPIFYHNNYYSVLYCRS